MKTFIYKIFISFFLSVFTLTLAFPQGEISLKAQADTNIIRIGEQFNVSFEINKPGDVNIQFPIFYDTIVEGIEIIQQSEIDTQWIDNNYVTLKQDYLLTSFDTGLYEIPPFPFQLTMNGFTDTIFSKPVPIGVFTVQLDTTNKIFDIKGPYEAKWSLMEILPYIGIFLLAVLVVGLVWIYVKRKKRKEPLIKKYRKPPDPPHVIAFRELDQLKKEKLWQQNKTKEYYSRLTEILRTYIEGRFGIMAMEQTTHEIMQSFARGYYISDELINELEKLLGLADMIKFAKGTALPDENETNFNRTYQFVEKTKQIKTETSSDNNEKKEPDTETKDKESK